MRLYEVFAERQSPLSLTELAAELEIPKSSCHAIVNTLLESGYLYILSHPRALYPTKKLWSVMQRVSERDPFLRHATLALESLRDAAKETVILGKRQGHAVVYLEILESHNPIRYSARQGDLKPLYSSAIGKAMLGSLKEQDLAKTLEDLPMPRVTDATIVTPQRLFDDIRTSKKRGYYLTRGENVPDVWAVAATVAIGSEVLGIAIAGPQHRMKPNLAAHVQSLLETSNLLGRQAGALL